MPDFLQAKAEFEATLPQDPSRQRRLRNLGVLWRERWVGSSDEMTYAIEYFVALTEDLGATAGFALAMALLDRYDLEGVEEDLAFALDVAQMSEALIADDHPHRSEYEYLVALCLWERYEATGSLPDLELAAEFAGRALNSSTPDTPDRARLMSSLAMIFFDLYQHFPSTETLDQIAGLAAAAVDACPADDPELPGFRSNLAGVLHARFTAQFGRPGDPLPASAVNVGDLEAAVDLYRLVADHEGPMDGDRGAFLANLGSALIDLAASYELRGDRARQERTSAEALRVLAEAIAITSPGSPHRADRLNKLGVGLRSTESLSEVRDVFRSACEAGMTAAPEMAMAAAANWLDWEMAGGRWSFALESHAYAQRAADQLRRAQALRRHQERWLIAFRQLSSEAAYAAVQLGNLPGGVVRLETSRAVLLAESSDTALAGLGAGLAGRYRAAAERVRLLENRP